jgi:hypothetical protein
MTTLNCFSIVLASVNTLFNSDHYRQIFELRAKYLGTWRYLDGCYYVFTGHVFGSITIDKALKTRPAEGVTLHAGIGCRRSLRPWP